jgi:hypothetical protein
MKFIHQKNTPKILIGAVTILVIICACFAYGYLSLKNNPERKSAAESRRTLHNISKHIILPENETPTIATVSDLEALKGQVFFARASLGDKVLIYPQTGRAILYNPKIKKIVDVAPLSQ